MACRELNITDYFIFHETKQALKGDLCFPQETEQARIYNYSFNSEYQDTESGLVYYNYRYYSPELGRWLSRDPIAESGGKNLYRFVYNNPIFWYDYLGREPAWYEPHGALDNIISDILGTNQVATGIVNTAAESDPTIPTLPPVAPQADFIGAELHFIGGFGAINVSCCDENEDRRTMTFIKLCIGGAIGGSISGGHVANFSGEQCRTKNYTGWFYELGVTGGPLGVGVDIGYNDTSSSNILQSTPNGVVEGGLTGGIGAAIKSTWCRYYQIGETEIEECGCACEE